MSGVRVHRSNAQCSKCSQWKCIENERWKGHEIENARRGRSSLLCATCKKDGCTKRSPNPFKCEGCQQQLGREHFDGQTLKDAKKRGDLIVCSACKSRERQILDTLKTLDASFCPCSSTWRHKESCTFLRKNKIRVKRADLEWLLFRPKNRVTTVTEISYYRAVSLLLE